MKDSKGGPAARDLRSIATSLDPQTRLVEYWLGNGPAPDPGTAVLAALAVATGLEAVVADAANRAAREGLRVLADGTPSRLRAVVAGVDAAVVRLAMTTRRGR